MPADAASAVILAALEGTTLSSEESTFLCSEGLAGFTLFRRNIPTENLAKLKTFITSIQAYSPDERPFLIAIDQEGGRVRRISHPFPDPGPALHLASGQGDSKSLAFVRDTAYLQSRLLLDFGINVNFAPVCDVLTENSNEAIGDRAFGDSPELVASRALAYLQGMNEAGILSCLKHFPGQGDAGEDTHLSQSLIQATRMQLDARELIPFQACLADCPMVMISHASYPALDQGPASLSPKVIQKLLREELGFKGLVVSDDMTMGAMPSSDQAWVAAIVESIRAGTDLILICKDLPRVARVLNALREEAKQSMGFAHRLQEAADKVNALRGALAR